MLKRASDTQYCMTQDAKRGPGEIPESATGEPKQDNGRYPQVTHYSYIYTW